MVIPHEIISEVVTGATTLTINQFWMWARKETPGYLRRRVDVLNAKVEELTKEVKSKDETISILTGNNQKLTKHNERLIVDLAAANKERRQAQTSLNKALTREADCDKTSKILLDKIERLEDELQAQATATEFTADRVFAIETGQDIADVAGKHLGPTPPS